MRLLSGDPTLRRKLACHMRYAPTTERHSDRRVLAGSRRCRSWWLKLGIEPRYFQPSSPQDDGRHEHMHRSLTAETSKPAAATPAERSGSSIVSAGTTTRSVRMRRWGRRPWHTLAAPVGALPTRLEDPWCDANHEVRRLRWNGVIKWKGRRGFHRRGAGGRDHRARRASERWPYRALLPSRSRGRRSRPLFPALCSAACAAPRRSVELAGAWCG
jgi:hypothetical protein